ncbi:MULTISPECIES: PadR family transcriptional regulator [Brevundimonas]|uniref:PadR family transcriptional regulator n=1 Tax=Brevundimonas sp. 357 TaxID=2555782 RepID=UPI001404E561|nr:MULTISPECIES: PadR family transcriptional regulator [Brevundimonas]
MRGSKGIGKRGHGLDQGRGHGFGRGWNAFGHGGHARSMWPEGRRQGEGRTRGEGHGRRGGGRMFEHGALRWVLLSLIADKPSHGYELIKAIEARMGGTYTPSPGVIYPSLTLLEDMGAVSVVAEGGKKRYAVTDEGRRLLGENAEALAHAERKMKVLRGRADRPARIAQAIEAFRAATHERLSQQPPLSEAQVEAIADLIEAAAEKVRQA